MADVATPPAAEAAQTKQQIVKPEKPDEDKYKEDLAKAEKEHTAAQEKLVGQHSLWLAFHATSSMRLWNVGLVHRAIGNMHRKRIFVPC
jgi:predicted nicotinamide N-methyase